MLASRDCRGVVTVVGALFKLAENVGPNLKGSCVVWVWRALVSLSQQVFPRVCSFYCSLCAQHQVETHKQITLSFQLLMRLNVDLFQTRWSIQDVEYWS